MNSIRMSALFATMLIPAMVSACVKPAPTPDPGPGPKPQIETPAILSVSLPVYPQAQITIDDSLSAVDIVLPYGSKLGRTQVEYVLTDSTTADPASGSVQDLSQPFKVFLTGKSGAARKYVFNTTLAKSNLTAFKWMTINDYYIQGSKSGSEISFTLPYGADLSSLSISVASDNVLSFEPDITTKADLSSPLTVKVIAEDGVTFKEYTLKADKFPEETESVRGVYLPSPTHTSSFLSYDSVCKSLDLLQELNFNCLFVGCWDKAKVAWDSEVLLANTNYQSISAGNMYRNYSGGSGDALADIISEAHKRNIKVILWFEYGFMHRVGGVDFTDPILAKHPGWIGFGSDGNYSNYNGTDFYLNAYDPQVQQFMLDLILEAVRLYPELDGVQGDDRLPASPRNSGYNESTKALYLAQTGREAPSDCNDAEWVKWRLDILNAFAVRMHDEVKALNSKCLVCFAPNKYPWAEGTLMQCWPQWVKDGAVDLLTVQCYVTANYENDVNSQAALMKENSDRMLFQPAMILKNGSALLPVELLSEELCHNRRVGTLGEAQFWFEGLNESEQARKLFKLFYSTPVAFPDL